MDNAFNGHSNGKIIRMKELPPKVILDPKIAYGTYGFCHYSMMVSYIQ